MLDTESYLNAWLAYGAATLVALGVLYVWIGARWSHSTRLGCALMLAALALAPAHPGTDVSTWAPAVFVAAFEFLTDGADAAMRPARSLLAGAGLGLAAWILVVALSRIFSRRASADR
ncbi:MAG: hypothetical protein AAGI24_10190 [Pseudomonadota bacterium]